MYQRKIVNSGIAGIFILELLFAVLEEFVPSFGPLPLILIKSFFLTLFIAVIFHYLLKSWHDSAVSFSYSYPRLIAISALIILCIHTFLAHLAILEWIDSALSRILVNGFFNSISLVIAFYFFTFHRKGSHLELSPLLVHRFSLQITALLAGFLLFITLSSILFLEFLRVERQDSIRIALAARERFLAAKMIQDRLLGILLMPDTLQDNSGPQVNWNQQVVNIPNALIEDPGDLFFQTARAMLSGGAVVADIFARKDRPPEVLSVSAMEDTLSRRYLMEAISKLSMLNKFLLKISFNFAHTDRHFAGQVILHQGEEIIHILDTMGRRLQHLFQRKISQITAWENVSLGFSLALFLALVFFSRYHIVKPYEEIQQKLITSENRLRHTIESMQSLIILMDEHGICREFYFPQNYDLPFAPETWQSRPLSECLPGSYSKSIEKSLNRIREGGEKSELEFHLLHHNEPHWYQLTITPRQNRDNSFNGFTAVLQDVTQRHQMALLQNSLDKIANLWRDTPTLNDFFSRIHETLQTLIPAPVFLVFKSLTSSSSAQLIYQQGEYESQTTIQGLVDYTIRQDSPVYLNKKQMLQLKEKMVLAVKNKLPWYWIAVPAILDDEVRVLIAVLSNSRDIELKTEHLEILRFITSQTAVALQRRQDQEELQKLALFPSRNPNPVLQLDEQMRITYANIEAEKLLHHWDCQVGDPIPAQVQEELQNSREFEMVVGKDVYTFLVAPIPEQKIVYLYGQNITAKKQVEEKLRENIAELERFNRLAVKRELRMIELKQEINELLTAQGESPKYKIPPEAEV